MNTNWTQLIISLTIIGGIFAIFFFVVFKGGNIDHVEFWTILMWLLLLLLVFLNLRPHWSVAKKYRRFYEMFLRNADDALQERLFGTKDLDKIEEKYRPFSRLIGGIVHGRVSGGNCVEVITDGARKYEALMQDLENARESIHIEYFHFGIDRGSRDVRDMLIKKAREGVKVKFINENVANFPIIHRYYRSMKSAGVEVIRFTGVKNFIMDFLAKLNYRNHRKIVVIDGRIGYTGGMNINDHYFKKWRDTHLRIVGESVATLQFIFLNSWVTSGGKLDETHLMDFFPKTGSSDAAATPMNAPDKCTRTVSDGGVQASDTAVRVSTDSEQPATDSKLVQIVSDEPGLNTHPIRLGYEWGLLNAERYFYIQTPYFTPPEPVLDALKAAALSGVDVRVMVPKKPDTFYMGPANRSFYRECLYAGVKIYERGGEFMHSKTFVSDDYLSCIGTANMDNRSFSIDYEDNAYMYDRELALQNKAIFEEDMKVCEEVTVEDVMHWKWYQIFLQKLIRIAAPLL